MANLNTIKLHPGDKLPYFDLPEADGGRVQTWDYYMRRHLALFFLHSVDCPRCRKMLKTLASAYEDITFEEAEVLAILPGSSTDAIRVKRELGLPFPVLSDESGVIYNRYGAVSDDGSKPEAAIFISDRFGEIYYVAFSDKEHELPPLPEIIRWLRFLEIQCPECGAPEWPR